jgi:hypothetical protein
MTSLEKLYTKNITNELKFFMGAHTTCFDIQFGSYGILKSDSNSGQILDKLGLKCLIRFLAHREGKTCWGLKTTSGGNQLSFSSPTQTHVFDNRSNNYNRLSTAHMWSSTGH